MKPTKHELHHVMAAIRMCRKASIQIERVRVILASYGPIANTGNAELFYLLADAADKIEQFNWLVEQTNKPE